MTEAGSSRVTPFLRSLLFCHENKRFHFSVCLLAWGEWGQKVRETREGTGRRRGRGRWEWTPCSDTSETRW